MKEPNNKKRILKGYKKKGKIFTLPPLQLAGHHPLVMQNKLCLKFFGGTY